MVIKPQGVNAGKTASQQMSYVLAVTTALQGASFRRYSALVQDWGMHQKGQNGIYRPKLRTLLFKGLVGEHAPF